MSYDVFIASDSEYAISGERKTLETELGIMPDRIGSALTLPAAYRSMDAVINQGGSIGVIVADLHMKGFGMSGIEEMMQRYGIPVVVMATLDDGASQRTIDDYRRAAARRGAADLLLKDAPGQEFAGVIEGILQQ